LSLSFLGVRLERLWVVWQEVSVYDTIDTVDPFELKESIKLLATEFAIKYNIILMMLNYHMI